MRSTAQLGSLPTDSTLLPISKKTLLSLKGNLVRAVTPKVLEPWRDRLIASKLGSRLAGGVIWSAFGAGVSRALGLAATIVMARILGKEAFGGLGIIQSTVAVFATFGTLSMGMTATKHVAEFRMKEPARAGRIIGICSLLSWTGGSLMALALALLAPWLARHTLAAPELAQPLRLAALFLLFCVVNEAQTGALSGFEAFRGKALIQFAGGIAAFPATVAGVYWFGLTGAIWGLVASQGFLVFLNYRGIRQAARQAGVAISWRGLRSEFSLLWGFSMPTFLGALIYVPAMWLANTIIVRTPNGYAEMGLFSAADRWRTAILFLPMLLGGVALPLLSNLRAQADSEKYYKVLWLNVGMSFGFALLAALPVALLSPWIMASYGRGFAEGSFILAMLCAVSVTTATFWTLGQSIASQGRMWFLLTINFLWASTLIGICWLLRSKGAAALAWAYLGADLLRLALVLTDVLHNKRRAVVAESAAAPVEITG